MPTDAPTPSGALLVWGDEPGARQLAGVSAETAFGTVYYACPGYGLIGWDALHDNNLIAAGLTDEAAARAACEADCRERMRSAGWVPAGSERERIARGLELEAELLPCAEDAAVTRSNANLVRADFSYNVAEALAEAQDAPPPVATVSADATGLAKPPPASPPSCPSPTRKRIATMEPDLMPCPFCGSNRRHAVPTSEVQTAREEALAEVAKWQKPSHVRLYAGEMTAQEMRSVQAVLGAISRALAAPPAVPAPPRDEQPGEGG